MTGRRALLTALAAVLGGALLAGLFFAAFERVVEDVDRGYTGAARLNPLLATERLLTRLGLPARTEMARLRLPAADNVVFLLSPREQMTEARLHALLEWVAGGGRLVAALSEDPAKDTLFRFFAVDARAGKDGLETLEVPLDDDRVKVSVLRSPRLVDTRRTAQTILGSDAGPFLLRYVHGKGEVTLLSDGALLRNDRIGAVQNARLAWWLAVSGRGAERALLVFRDDLPTLGALLFRHAWMVLLSLALLVLAALRAKGSRFGPILPDPSSDRRSLLDHLRASGEFLFRHGQSAALVDAARRGLHRRLEIAQPGLLRLPKKELARRLAGPAGVPAPRAERALSGSSFDDEAELVAAIQTLEALRRSV